MVLCSEGVGEPGNTVEDSFIKLDTDIGLIVFLIWADSTNMLLDGICSCFVIRLAGLGDRLIVGLSLVLGGSGGVDVDVNVNVDDVWTGEFGCPFSCFFSAFSPPPESRDDMLITLFIMLEFL
jgi:hypothetical protein